MKELNGRELAGYIKERQAHQVRHLRAIKKFPKLVIFYDNDSPASPIGGERGFISIECGGRFPAPGDTFPSPKASVGWLRCHVGSMYEYLSAVADQRPFSPSLSDGAYVQSVMLAALESDRRHGARVEVDAP